MSTTKTACVISTGRIICRYKKFYSVFEEPVRVPHYQKGCIYKNHHQLYIVHSLDNFKIGFRKMSSLVSPSSQANKSDFMNRRPKVVVVGAGVVGVSTAYYLAKSGCDVIVLERGKDLAQGTSYANAGRFCPSLLVNYPLAKPSKLKDMIASTFGRAKSFITGEKKEHRSGNVDVPSNVEFSISNMIFGYFFLKNSFLSEKQQEKQNKAFINLANTCRASMNAIYQEEMLGDVTEKSGDNIWLYGSMKDFETDGVKKAKGAAAQGFHFTKLSNRDCANYYPFLKERIQKLNGGGGCIVSHGDWTADARMFIEAVALKCQKMGNDGGNNLPGVTFHFNKFVKDLVLSKDESGKFVTAGVRTKTDETFKADAVVICSGPQSASLLKQITKTKIPLGSMKGCTIDLYGVKNGPTATLADHSSGALNYNQTKFADGRVRITGFADFVADSGENVSDSCPNGVVCSDHYERLLIAYTRENYPNMTWTHMRKPWCGLRPVTPDFLPVVGLAPNSANVFLNCGHGSMGWTLSTGTGLLLANDLVNSMKDFVPAKGWQKYKDMLEANGGGDVRPFSPERFTWF